MLRSSYKNTFLPRIQRFPLSSLGFSLRKRLLIVTLSYVVGVVGLWYLFPLIYNGSSMFLPIVAASWLFRYRGMIGSLVLNGLAFQLLYIFVVHGMLPQQAFVEGALLGFGTSLGLALVVCWLRTATDLLYVARQRASVAEQEQLQALESKRYATLAYEYQCKLNVLKDDLLLHVSHEFRTPLSVLGGVLDLLSESFEELGLAERTDLLIQAHANQEELVNLVERVLDATTVMDDLPQVQSEVVVLQQVIQDVLFRLDTQLVHAYTIHVRISEDLHAWADPQFLRQVLQNLLSNVFKYVPRQTEISIEATQLTPSSPILLSVQDAGPGIPPEEISLLFERFARLKRDLTGTTRGTGLGLYICKRFVEAMGGQIWVESSGQQGAGSRFYFTLPPVALTFPGL